MYVCIVLTEKMLLYCERRCKYHCTIVLKLICGTVNCVDRMLYIDTSPPLTVGLAAAAIAAVVTLVMLL